MKIDVIQLEIYVIQYITENIIQDTSFVSYLNVYLFNSDTMSDCFVLHLLLYAAAKVLSLAKSVIITSHTIIEWSG